MIFLFNFLSLSLVKKKRVFKLLSFIFVFFVENKLDIAVIDVVKKSEILFIGIISVVIKKLEFASIFIFIFESIFRIFRV